MKRGKPRVRTERGVLPPTPPKPPALDPSTLDPTRAMLREIWDEVSNR